MAPRPVLAISALTVLIVLGVPQRSQADLNDYLHNLGISGEGTVGALAVDRQGKSSKFEEYREVPENQPFLDELKIDLDGKGTGYFVEFRTEDTFEDDQRYVLRIGRYGEYETEVRWDEIPHVLSNSGRNLFQSQGNGVFTIADEIQRTLQDHPEQAGLILAVAPGGPLRVDRQTGSFSFRYTPAPAWDLHLGYTVRRDEGLRPLGTAFFFTSIVETLRPIDELTHEVNASIEYARPGGSLRLAYTGSLFRNETDAVTWDNPFRADDAELNPSRGRLDLDPDNQAHAISVDGALNLPWSSRLIGTLSYGWMRQDDRFLPFTINGAINSPSLPAQSLGGESHPLMIDYGLTSGPLADLTLKARYRRYDLNNDSPSLVFPGYVRTDAVLGPARRSLPYDYSVQRGGAEASYRLRTWSTLSLGWQWENWHRKFRETRVSDEHRVGPSIDIQALEWLSLNGAYRHSIRGANAYDPSAPTASFPNGEEVQDERLPALRKFDEATRVRDELVFLSRFTIVAPLNVATSVTLASDDYTRSEFGLLQDTYISPAVDLSFTPISRVSVFANYTWEGYDTRQRSRERPVDQVQNQQIAVDDPALDWVAEGRDTVNTVSLGTDLVLIPELLGFKVDFSVSDAKARLDTGGPNPNATDFPEVRNRLQQLDAIFRYNIRKHTVVGVGYRFEKYDETDFATTAIVGGDKIKPFMGDVDPGSARSAYLGAFADDYTAHIGLATLSFGW